jgi:hypothetical protein
MHIVSFFKNFYTSTNAPMEILERRKKAQTTDISQSFLVPDLLAYVIKVLWRSVERQVLSWVHF